MMKSFAISALLVFSFFGAWPASAQETSPTVQPTEYQLLEPLPAVSGPQGQECVTADGKPCASTDTYLPGLMRLLIMLATGMAVVMIIYAGVKYMSTDAFSGKEEAKGIISGALWGLLLAMSAWLILNTINPRLVTIDLNIKPLPIQGELPTITDISDPTGGCPTPLCETVAIDHKSPPYGCRAPGPCRVRANLNEKLIAFEEAFGDILVTEAYPPTREHQNSCHASGDCVDMQAVSANRIYEFINKAGEAGLKAVFEVESQARKDEIIRAACGRGSAADCSARLGRCITPLPPRDGRRQITGEHFSVYNESACR